MLTFIVVRVAQMVPVLIGISLAMFVLVRVVPGDPAQVALGLYATPEAMAELRTLWGLDEPLYVQYWCSCSSFCAATSAIPTFTDSRRFRWSMSA